jgi:hypothetical protein
MIKEYFSVNEHHIEIVKLQPNSYNRCRNLEERKKELKVARFHQELEIYFNEGLYTSNVVDLIIGLAPKIFGNDLLIVQKTEDSSFIKAKQICMIHN